MDHAANTKIITDSEWSDGTVFLLTKWERVCKRRKAAHYSSARNFGWKNKLLSIPTILISTILGSLSFIHPSFMEQSSSRMLSVRNLQPEWPTCACDSYLNGASGSDLCQKMETTECYPTLGGPCPTNMYECINMPTKVPTESPTFDDCPAGGYCTPCGTCSPGRCDDNSCPLFDEHCSCADGSCPSKVGLSICSTITPTFSPTSPTERCENYCQNSCAQFGSPEDNVSECQGCDTSRACHPGASDYNNVDAWCAFYPCDSGNSRCDNWRCTQPTNAPTPSERIIYNEAVSGEAHGTSNVGVDTLPLATGTNTILGTLKSPHVNDYYRVLAPGGATITAMRLTVSGDGTNGVREAALRFFNAVGQFAGQTGGGLIPSVPANAVSMLVAPSSFSPSAPGFAGWAHEQGEFLFALMAASASGMSDNDYIIEIDCVVQPTPSPTATDIPTNLPPTPSPTATNTPTNLPPTPSPITNTPTEIHELANGDCTELCGGSFGACPNIGGIDIGMWDCQCCYQYWHACSFSFCSDWCYPNCDSSPTLSPSPCSEGTCHIVEDSTDCVASQLMVATCSGGDWNDECISESIIPDECLDETDSPTTVPPIPSPSNMPTPVPSNMPTPVPSNQPTTTYSYDRILSSAPTCDRNYENNSTMFPYIIGGFNMFIALISALHAFLKYDTLEDRHHQYSRHFSNLQVDLETVLAKPVSQRGSAGTMIERYKTKYAILINNAPDLSETLEKTCCGAEDSVPVAIEMT